MTFDKYANTLFSIFSIKHRNLFFNFVVKIKQADC
jgi:hypothetical protein